MLDKIFDLIKEKRSSEFNLEILNSADISQLYREIKENISFGKDDLLDNFVNLLLKMLEKSSDEQCRYYFKYGIGIGAEIKSFDFI